MVDGVTRPGLAQNLNDLVAALVAKGAISHFAGEIGADDVERQAALQHMVERRPRTGQHDRLHFATTDSSKKIDAVADRRTAGDEAQRILPHLIG